MEGVNSIMIYCKKCVNVTMYPQYNNNNIYVCIHKIKLKNLVSKFVHVLRF
jgi:hypothetical protein